MTIVRIVLPNGTAIAEARLPSVPRVGESVSISYCEHEVIKVLHRFEPGTTPVVDVYVEAV